MLVHEFLERLDVLAGLFRRGGGYRMAGHGYTEVIAS